MILFPTMVAFCVLEQPLNRARDRTSSDVIFFIIVEDYDAVSEGRANGVDSSDWIYPSTRPMRSICPIASMFFFKLNFII